MMTAPPRKGRLLKALVAIGVLIAIAAGIVIAFWPQIFEAIEQEMIRADRTERRAIASSGRALPGTPDLANMSGRLAAQGLTLGAPIFVRIFKREFELELWMLRNGRFERFATYPICFWSGDLGPKLRQGDRQAPEGFYTVEETALNPASKYHRSFNLGFPNAFDRAHGRTGSLLMVHGSCGSIGCYAMTDPVIDEIWALVTAALKAGQKRFQVQVFPFRMTDTNMSRHAQSESAPFWRELKQGYDLFEQEHLPPQVSVCEGRYVFRPAGATKDGSSTIDNTCPARQNGS